MSLSVATYSGTRHDVRRLETNPALRSGYVEAAALLDPVLAGEVKARRDPMPGRWQ
jgi:hypothetical protein